MTDDNHLPTAYSEPDQEEKSSVKKNNPIRWLYIGATIVATVIAVSFLAYLALETIQQADRKIETGAEKHSRVTKNSTLFKKSLDDKRAGKSVQYCIAELAPIQNNVNTKRMKLGFEAYARLKQYVDEKDEIHYEDLRDQLSPFLHEVRSHYDISPDTLYFAYLARDITLYIFSHKEVFLIHDSDTSIMGTDSRSLKAFYTDALTVYNLVKRIQRDLLNDDEGFRKDADNGNLFIVAMYCQARWATAGMDDSQTVDAVLQALNAKEFYLAGQQGPWLKWLQKDLKDVRDSMTRIQVQPNRPDFVSTTWLE